MILNLWLKLIKFQQNTTIYRSMVYNLIFLTFSAIILAYVKILPFNPVDIFWQTGYLIFACFIINQIIAKLFGVKPNPESQLITALILSLIIGPLPVLSNLTILTFVAFVAMASKYFIVYQKRHIFNPAGFGVLVSALAFGQSASWWVGSLAMAPFIIIGGALVLYKNRKLDLAISFLVTYIMALSILVSLNGSIKTLPDVIYTILLVSPILFFTTVMLIEPMTTPATRQLRIFYGISIGLILVILQNNLVVGYTLELTLLVGNLIFRLLNPTPRLTLTLVEKMETASNIISFWFSPDRNLAWNAGQYLEYSLPHQNPDSRGIRRWFTIASSPNEKNILLTTKFNPEKSSTFKTKLKSLKIGEEVTASQLEGDFTLPVNKSQKLVFIAGGIGITPFRAMVENLINSKEKRDITLIYIANSKTELAFTKLFENAKKIGITTIYKIGTGYRLTENEVKKLVPDWQDRTFYLSGPKPMVASYEGMLGKMGINKSHLKTDFFPGY